MKNYVFVDILYSLTFWFLYHYPALEEFYNCLPVGGFTIDGEKSFGKTIHFKRKSSSCSNLYCTLQSILALDLLVLVILKDYNFKTANKIIGW